MEKTYLQEVGERLYEFRNGNFISRHELAKRAEVSVSSVIRMERGETAVGIDDAVKICRVLGCSLDYLLTGNYGLSEIIKINRRILDLPDIYTRNLEKVAQAFWATCPKYHP